MTELIAELRAMGWGRVISVPVVSALIGWGTNWLAVRMLFRPQKPFNLLGWRIQGLIPKRQKDLAASIGHTVEQHLISHNDVLAILNRPDANVALDETIRAKVATFIDTKLKSLHPMVGMFLSDSIKQKLQGHMVEEIRQWVPQLGEQMISRLEDELDFREIVEQKVSQFDLGQLERIILEIAGRELKAIELLGGVLGFAIGLAQLLILVL